MTVIRIAALACALLLALPAQAAVFKCVKNGQSSYSDVPCPLPPSERPVATAQSPEPESPLGTPAATAGESQDAAATLEPATAIEPALGAASLATAPMPEAATVSIEPAAPAVLEAASVIEDREVEEPTQTIALPNGKAQLKLPRTYRYLNPEESKHILEEVWGNPPGTADGVDGMIVPAGVDAEAAESWGVVITYTDDGHVSDEDANEIDFDDLLKDMKEGVASENEQRVEQGYGSIELVGWAEPPHYDAAAKKIYWAKDLVFNGNSEHTLNYAIRVLGREGVLELNAVSGTEQIGTIKRAMENIVVAAEFTKGNTYAEYNPDTDRLASYGLAALVAGGLAAKKGLFAGLILLVLKLKKLAFLAVLGLAALAKKFLDGRKA